MQNVTLFTQAFIQTKMFNPEKHVNSLINTSFMKFFLNTHCPPITLQQYIVKIYTVFSCLHPNLPTKIITSTSPACDAYVPFQV